MAARVWLWQVGLTPDGAPMLEKHPVSAGFAPPPGARLAEQDEQAWREEIMAELEEVDRKSIRPLREGDSVRLVSLEERAKILRKRLLSIA